MSTQDPTSGGMVVPFRGSDCAQRGRVAKCVIGETTSQADALRDDNLFTNMTIVYIWRLTTRRPFSRQCKLKMGRLNRRPTQIETIQSQLYLDSATTCATNGTALGVPRPVTLSHPGPVVSDESVPKVKTSQRVEVEL